MARVNGVQIGGASVAEMRLVAMRELLRQRAHALGLADDDASLEELLEREAKTPAPTEAECRRFYDVHARDCRSGDLVFARHILFAVTAGALVEALRRKAEETLHALQREPARFSEIAQQCSNCPSAAQGGNLGQLARGDCVPEFSAALLEGDGLGVLARLVNTRYGFHIVCIDRRAEGKQVPFEALRERIAAHLTEHVRATALTQYVSVLAGRAEVEGVDLVGAATPLVQ